MFESYVPIGGFDEYMSPSHTPRKAMGALMDQLGALGLPQLNENHRAAEQLLKRLGATFRLYNSNSEASERILPFDPLPRLIDQQDWAVLEAGLIQRLEAIDLFLSDIYGEQKIIKDGIIPAEDILSSQGWRPQMQDVVPPLARWCHISGLDLIRDGDGTWRVLEDNLRCPSGVAYFLENRRVMKQLFGGLFQSQRITPIDNYASQLLQTLQEMAP